MRIELEVIHTSELKRNVKRSLDARKKKIFTLSGEIDRKLDLYLTLSDEELKKHFAHKPRMPFRLSRQDL